MIKDETKKLLLKKWKANLTRYNRYKLDGRMRIYKRGLVTVKVDLSPNKDYYLKEIEKANKIIEKLAVL